MRGSRFISRTQPASSQEEVREILRQVRELIPDATHNCYAYRLMQQGDDLEEYAIDAGEPSGSAGIPMLHALRQLGLVDVVAWVGRYFGGTKLGISGLMTAYARAIRMSLEGITPVPWVAMVDVHVVLPYTLADRVKSELQRIEGIVLTEEYSQQVALGLEVPRHAARDFVSRMREWSRGGIQATSSAIDFGTEHA
ncbi:MAG: YigZ family protein [Fidelibacterota bacterium]|nr:MAG: YigZ family protein [Candidatus Neomarinimicrobiota bacterium]